MSFGFGVGDFLRSIELATRIRKRFVDAPVQFTAISTEVKSLSNVLRDVEDVKDDTELTLAQKADWDAIARGCKDVLQDLEKTLDGYQDLQPTPTGLKSRSRRIWKRLDWDQKDIADLRNRITSNVSLLSRFLDNINSRKSTATSAAIKEGVEKLNIRHDQHERRKERDELLEWLTPVDYGSQQSDNFARCQEGTGQWLLESDEFQTWFRKRGRTLFCPGIPGAGKTILTSIVVNYLKESLRSEPEANVVYLYCNFRRQEEQKPVDLFANLLKQLLQSRSSIPDTVKTLFKEHQEKRTRLTFETILKILQTVIPPSDTSRTFIVIDALDEFQMAGGPRQRFLQNISELQETTRLNLFVTSRFIPEIVEYFRINFSREIRASSADVQRYLDNHMYVLPAFVSKNAELQQEIKDQIHDAADGMFLLVKLNLDSLQGKRSPKAIRKALQSLPHGSQSLDTAYREAMERIQGQIEDQAQLAMQVLSWITHAKRPMTTIELQHALAIEPDELEFDPDNLSDIQEMVSCCAGLVTIDDESNIIRLVHYTTQQFFERTRETWFKNAEADIVRACVTYLSYDEFDQPCSAEMLVERLLSFPLYDYASQNWGRYAIQESDIEHGSICRFLGSISKVTASYAAIRYVDYRNRDLHHGDRIIQGVTGLHLASWFGCLDVVSILLKDGISPNVRDSKMCCPLHWASVRGHVPVVQLLLEHGAKLETRDTIGQTALYVAVDCGRTNVVEFLLGQGADVARIPDDGYGRTPLLLAAIRGYTPIVELLSKGDVNMSYEDQNGFTALDLAAFSGEEQTVGSLLNHGADINHQKTNGRTTLIEAASCGRVDIVKYLLDKGAGVHFRDHEGWTALFMAAAEGDEATAKLLLDNSADIHHEDHDGMTALMLAALKGDPAMVRLLLDRGADIEFINNRGERPLHYAAALGEQGMVEILVEAGARVDAPDDKQRTALSWAAHGGYQTIVEFLIHKKASVDDVDIGGRTPLSWAAGCESLQRTEFYSWNERLHVVRFLVKNGAVIDAPDFNGRTPLSFAAEGGAMQVIKYLVEKGVARHSKDKGGYTPAMHASKQGRMEIAAFIGEFTIEELSFNDLSEARAAELEPYRRRWKDFYG